MGTTVENIFAVAAAMPGVYGFICLIRRSFNAQRAARLVKDTHQEEWNNLHWLAQRNSWAGVEVLISKGLISGPQVDEYRARDALAHRLMNTARVMNIWKRPLGSGYLYQPYCCLLSLY
jgi:hypothetical protein